MRHRLLALVLCAATLLAARPGLAHAATDAELIAALASPGHLGLMRHARAPGSDDPPEFRIGDCSTQRNLSAGGRTQAEAIGAVLRAGGLSRALVYASEWCRAQDTARLLGVGTVTALPSLNSLVSYPGESAEMTAATRRWIQMQPLQAPTLLVTHQVNIQALVGALPLEGDIVVVERTRGGSLRVLGTLVAAPAR